MLSTTTPVAVLAIVAYAILAAAGAVQWHRARSFAAAMVAIGFGLVLIGRVIALVEYLETAGAHPVDTLFVVHHHAFLQHLSLVGLWIAAVGLARQATSPNNRWRGP